MGRWTKFDEDAERLPHGMQRIGYDADDQTYTYRDQDGSTWRGAPGARYGTLHRISTGSATKGSKSNMTSSPTSASSEDSPTSPYTKTVKAMPTELHPAFRTKDEEAPPPPYQKPSRRFTDFDQILGKDGGEKEEGLLASVKRSFSVRNKTTRPSNKPAQSRPAARPPPPSSFPSGRAGPGSRRGTV